MANQNTNMNMLKDSIPLLVRKLAVPAATGLFFTTMFNVTDTFYTRFISSAALAGLSLSFPVYIILIAVGAGLGAAVQALSANALGGHNEKQGALYGISAFLLSLILGICIGISGYILLKPVLRLAGAEGAALQEAVRYSSIIISGILFFYINAICNGILSARGDTKTYRNFLVIGFFANLLLDPFFIFVLKLDTVGIALATVLVQLIGTLFLGKKVLSLKLSEITGKLSKQQLLHDWKELLLQAVPISFNTMSIALGVFIINYFLLKYGGAAAAAGYGAAIRIEQILLMPVMGLNTAIITITGHNNGAGNIDRVKKSWLTGQMYGVGIMAAGAVLLYPFRNFWMGIFTQDPQVISAGANYISVEVFSMFSYVFLNMGVSTLQGLKKPRFILVMGLLRQIALPPLVFYGLGTVAGLQLWGVWYGLLVIPTSAALATVWYTGKQLMLAQHKRDKTPTAYSRP